MNGQSKAPGPIQRVLDLARPSLPRSTCAAEAALAEALRGIAGSTWPEVAWCFSRINGDGFPVEFTFSSAQPGVRYTAEIAGPEVAEHDRWKIALDWTGGSVPQVQSQVEQLQAEPLAWGAWVGGFHSEKGERRKAYIEASSVSHPEQESSSNRFAVTSAIPGARLRFIGLEPNGDESEFYYRKDMLEVSELGRLARRLGWRECYEPLCEAVSATLPQPGHEFLVPTDSGFSIAPGRALSVFTYARSIWGGDASIRRCVLELASKMSWDFQLYEAVTRPLESATGYRTYHGVIAWNSITGRPAEFRISVRPPGHGVVQEY